MPQRSLYLDDPMMEGLRQDASREGKTLSKYAAGVLRERKEHNGWPPGVFNLYGACDDDTFVVPPEIPWELDAPRKTL